MSSYRVKLTLSAFIIISLIAAVTFFYINSEIDYSELIAQAEENNALSQFTVAYLYKNGVYVDQDLDEAREWLLRSAENGYIDAHLTIGGAYASGGWGLKKDIHKARSWFMQAKSKGSKSADAFLLGLENQ